MSDVSKSFGDGTLAIDSVSLEVATGEFVAMVGPSGCGKSTLLRIVAGLTKPTGGRCECRAAGTPAFVFQEPALLPWRNVWRNAQLLMELEGYSREQRRERVQETLALVGLSGFEQSYPHGLSGGMKMRLSLARSLALRPALFLMDEPFAAVDEITREALNDELLRLWGVEPFTAMFVTHHVGEAVYLANRVVVMSDRPSHVIECVDVPFPYPRTRDLRATPEFAALTAKISGVLRTKDGPCQ